MNPPSGGFCPKAADFDTVRYARHDGISAGHVRAARIDTLAFFRRTPRSAPKPKLRRRADESHHGVEANAVMLTTDTGYEHD